MLRPVSLEARGGQSGSCGFPRPDLLHPLLTVQPPSSLPPRKAGDLDKTQQWTQARKPSGGKGEGWLPAGLPSLHPFLPGLPRLAELTAVVPGVNQQCHHQLPDGKSALWLHQAPHLNRRSAATSQLCLGKHRPEKDRAFQTRSRATRKPNNHTRPPSQLLGGGNNGEAEGNKGNVGPAENLGGQTQPEQ